MSRVILITLLSVLTEPVLAASPWLPEPGGMTLSISYLSESFDEFYRADQDQQLPADIEQTTLRFAFEYGLSDLVSLGFKTGFTETHFAPASRGDFSGVDDSEIDIRWRFVDEYLSEKAMPTITLRLAAIIAGNYEASSAGNPHSPGDGESGYSASIIVGKVLHSWSLLGELGYRDRASPVPSEVFLNIGAYYTFSQNFAAGISYFNESANEGLDIGGPGFDASRFPELQEEKEIVSLSASYFINNRSSMGIDVAQTIDGENTGQKDILVVRYSYTY